MNNFKIPKSINILGNTIKIEFDDKLHYKDDATGEARYRDNKIILQKNNDGHERTIEQLEHDYLHELVHFIFHFIYELEFRDDEKLVHLFSGILHQAFKTAKYD